MRGTVLYGPRDIRFEERTAPTIMKPTDAIIRITATQRSRSAFHNDQDKRAFFSAATNFTAKSSRLSLTPRLRAASINRSNCAGSVLFGRFFGFASAFAIRPLSCEASGKPLADDTLERPRGALINIYAELHSVTRAGSLGD